MYPDIWQSLVSGHYPSQSAHLFGFQRVFIRGDRYPVLRPAAQQQSVAGVVYHNINRRDLNRLDVFEGEFYQRVRVTLFNREHQKCTAEVYLLKPKYRHLASKRPWAPEYFEHKLKLQFQRTYCKRHSR